MDATITLREYLRKKKDFVIPEYQRGYIWGKKRPGNEKDSVSYILEKTIIPSFQKGTEVFLQGITVHENDGRIIIIDGQQRTTFLYLLLKWLGYKDKFSLNYEVRPESDSFLKSAELLANYEDNQEEEYQDIYFFKKTLRLISSILMPYAKDEMLGYLLDKIKFLYINIPKPEQATKVFSMMNGNRAVMLAEEVIKAELLRMASLSNDNQVICEPQEQMAQEWDCSLLRSRYAREWDKWLQWWNRDDVKYLYRCNNVMGRLISTFMQTSPKHTILTFENFREAFLGSSKAVEAKKAFDGLRRLQKRFEDAFNDPQVYNRIGAILRIGDIAEFIKWYFLGTKKTLEELDRYYRYAFLNLTHKEIVEDNREQFEIKYALIRKALEDDFIFFSENKEIAYRLLLRLNIDEDIKLKDRKFDFRIWDSRSLEHIYPKSKVFHYNKEQSLWLDGNECPLSPQEKPQSNEYLDRNNCKCKDGSATEHSIGNLVLLYGGNNSEFCDKPFEEKKKMFFIPSVKNIFASRHLLHTIFKFAQSHWSGEEIAINKYNTIREFEVYYGKQN